MSTNNGQYDLYDLIDTHVNADTIKGLLRTLKADRDKDDRPDNLRVGGNKSELIDRLKVLVRQDVLDPIKVFDLLRDAEENGSQRIFYFRPLRDRSRTLGHPDEVGHTLFGAGWATRFKIPQLTKSENGEMVDYRVHPTKPKDWILKVYLCDTHKKFIDRTNPDVQRRFQETWQFEEERSVMVIRWNCISADDGWLEFRIPKGIEGKRDVHVAYLWRIIDAVVREDQCVRANLEPAMKRIFADQKKNAAIYRLADAQVWDARSHGYTVAPLDPDHDCLADTTDGVDVIQRVFEKGGECGSLVVEWLSEGSNGSVPKNLRCVLGGPTRNRLNQVVISAETTPAAVDYVTDYLRHFGS